MKNWVLDQFSEFIRGVRFLGTLPIFYLKSFSCYTSPTFVPSSESANWKARYVGVWLGGYKNGNFLIFWYNNVFNLTYSQRFQLFFSLLVLHTNGAANKNDEEEDNSCSGSSNYDWYYIIPLKKKFNISVNVLKSDFKWIGKSIEWA